MEIETPQPLVMAPQGMEAVTLNPTPTQIIPQENAVRLFVAVPSCRDWKYSFGSSISGLISHIYQYGVGGGMVSKFRMKYFAGASLLPQSRQFILNEALALDANGQPEYTHLMMFDDDMVFPPDVVARLLQDSKPIVAANYCRKAQDEIKGSAYSLDGQHMDSTGKTGVEEAMYIGLGMCLVRLDTIRHIAKPHFEILWDESRQDYWGEDMYFCEKIRRFGVPIFIDHDVSNMIGHVGDYVYHFPNGQKCRLGGEKVEQKAPEPVFDADKIVQLFKEPLEMAAE